MGHANVSNLSDLMLRGIYARGKLSLREMVETAMKRGESLHASEGEYTDEGMIDYGFLELINFHARYWCQNNNRPNIEAVCESEDERLLAESFVDGAGDFSDWESDAYKRFREIKWRFTEGTRKMYIDKTIPTISSVTN